MAEIGDREARLETTISRIFDCLDRNDASQARVEGNLSGRMDQMDGRFDRVETQLDTMNTELARLSGRIEVFSSCWTFLMIMMSIATGLFVSLVGAVVATYHMP